MPQIFRELTQCSDCTGDLAVAISYNFYGQEAFTIGEITGTIGPAKDGEPLNFGGDRKLDTTHPHLVFPSDHICTKWPPTDENFMPWTNMAPFMVDKGRSTLHQ